MSPCTSENILDYSLAEEVKKVNRNKAETVYPNLDVFIISL